MFWLMFTWHAGEHKIFNLSLSVVLFWFVFVLKLFILILQDTFLCHGAAIYHNIFVWVSGCMCPNGQNTSVGILACVKYLCRYLSTCSLVASVVLKFKSSLSYMLKWSVTTYNKILILQNPRTTTKINYSTFININKIQRLCKHKVQYEHKTYMCSVLQSELE